MVDFRVLCCLEFSSRKTVESSHIDNANTKTDLIDVVINSSRDSAHGVRDLVDIVFVDKKDHNCNIVLCHTYSESIYGS